ncbi:MAG: hypothetical protein EXR37_02085 [Limnohabitans sp.]|nr:hypothetical protein [Limnohabitans sp.]
MKLQPDRSDSLTVTAYTASWIAINGVRYSHHLLISYNGLIQAWPSQSFSGIQAAHLDLITPTGAEIVLIGCGKKQLFAPPSLTGAFIERHMGVEAMDTAAACRTFNILAAEDRRVAAILLLEVPCTE